MASISLNSACLTSCHFGADLAIFSSWRSTPPGGFQRQVKENAAGRVRAHLMLMVTVIYNDLTCISWIEHLMPALKLHDFLEVAALMNSVDLRFCTRSGAAGSALTSRRPVFGNQVDIQRLQDSIDDASRA
jgi:hypothetical protein